MLRRGGTYDGGRLLGPHRLAHMARNHLPGNADLETFGRPLYAEVPLRGVGFGLGFSTVIDPVRYGGEGKGGDLSWGRVPTNQVHRRPGGVLNGRSWESGAV